MVSRHHTISTGLQSLTFEVYRQLSTGKNTLVTPLDRCSESSMPFSQSAVLPVSPSRHMQTTGLVDVGLCSLAMSVSVDFTG